jgi:uncharacterized protein (TIGR00290 family)
MIEKILFAWSGGKDSAMALYELQKSQNYEILALLTTITEEYDRISMHGVRKILLEQQAESLEFPLEKIYITKNASDKEYETRMRDKLITYKRLGVSAVGFGDIFLEDLKKYREENLSKVNLKGIFPIWKRNSLELACAFIDLGFKAIITCVDSKVLDKTFVGRLFDRDFLNFLPSGVDSCGENGEFHSFVYAGPIFKNEILFDFGEITLRENRFFYCDLIPVEKAICCFQGIKILI